MSDPRVLGLTLMALATAAFLGTTSETLPSETFFPALAVFALGAIRFLRGNHAAIEEAEKKAHQSVNPVLHENRPAAALAERQAMRRGAALNALSSEADAPEPTALPAAPTVPNEIVLESNEEDFIVDTDVSFPVEVQRGDALADQLRKLNLLLEQGVLTEEEYAVAKAKLLG